eukprot:TRINITY_DN9186_c0_g1_i4.p2 TRINITY_DN9186_c0_g1~~TRINITY_DN9186_c0_g1_i4.p2  ORF type:complete len:105 (+),score=7.54 TRINITY_DN9186_c0_g1_i4:141-455(+)
MLEKSKSMGPSTVDCFAFLIMTSRRSRWFVLGLGFGQLCRAPALGSSWTFGLSENELVFILYGVHRAGKWEIIRRSGRGQLELTHRVGRRSVCCLAEGRLRGVP